MSFLNQPTSDACLLEDACQLGRACIRDGKLLQQVNDVNISCAIDTCEIKGIRGRFGALDEDLKRNFEAKLSLNADLYLTLSSK